MPTPFPEDCARLFEPVRLLARGGCGAVYLAEQVALGRRPAAVKLLSATLDDESGLKARFIREARVTARLAHPNVIGILDHGVATGAPWIAYEYVEGGSLRAKLDAGALPLADAAVAIKQVAAALTAAHAEGILHRDIKPENVLVAGPNAYKLTDFGIAYWSSSTTIATKTGVVLGTPAYLAPELLCDEEPTPAVDVYALTVMLYALIAGREPFLSERLPDLLEMHLTAPPPALHGAVPGVPRAIDGLVARGMAKRPADRFATPDELVVALDLALSRSGRPTAAPRSRSVPKPGGVATTVVSARGSAPIARAAAWALGFGLASLAGIAWTRLAVFRVPRPTPSATALAATPASPVDAIAPEPAELPRWAPVNKVVQAILDQVVPARNSASSKKPRDSLVILGGEAHVESEARVLESALHTIQPPIHDGVLLGGWPLIRLECAANAIVGLANSIKQAVFVEGRTLERPVLNAIQDMADAFRPPHPDVYAEFAHEMIELDAQDVLGDLLRHRESLRRTLGALDRLLAAHPLTTLPLDARTALGDCCYRISLRGMTYGAVRQANAARCRVCEIAIGIVRDQPIWYTVPASCSRVVEALEACRFLATNGEKGVARLFADRLIPEVRAHPPRQRDSAPFLKDLEGAL